MGIFIADIVGRTIADLIMVGFVVYAVRCGIRNVRAARREGK